LSICEIKKKKLESFSLYRLRNTMIRCVVYLLRIFKMFHGLMNNPVYENNKERVKIFNERFHVFVPHDITKETEL